MRKRWIWFIICGPLRRKTGGTISNDQIIICLGVVLGLPAIDQSCANVGFSCVRYSVSSLGLLFFLSFSLSFTFVRMTDSFGTKFQVVRALYTCTSTSSRTALTPPLLFSSVGTSTHGSHFSSQLLVDFPFCLGFFELLKWTFENFNQKEKVAFLIKVW